MRAWVRKPVGALLLVALLAMWGIAQSPPPFLGRIKVEISPVEAGDVSLVPPGDPFGGIYHYTSPTTVTLTASRYSGYAFVHWEIWRSIPASGDPEIRTGNTTTISLSSQYPDWTVRAVFQEVGSLKVTIQPPEAVAAGAQWKAVRNGYDSGWKNSGETLTNLPVGQYTVTFKDIPNWTKPEDQTVTIQKDTLTEITGTYVSLALFYEDFEDITGWTLSGLWHRCDKICAWDCNAPLQGNYAHYAAVRDGTCTCSYDTGRRTLGYLTSPVIEVPANTELVLMFDFARAVENYTRATRDRTYVQYRLGREVRGRISWTAWRTVWSRSSRNPSPECGTSGAILIRTGRYTTLQIRFVFDSVNRYNNNFPGWAIDNVRILPRELLPAGIPLAEEYVEEFEPLDEEPLFVLTVSPNPVTGRMVVFSVDGVEAEALQVEVYDLGGRLVYKTETFGGQLAWDTLDATGQPVANGVYLVLAKVKVDGEWLAADLQKILILR